MVAMEEGKIDFVVRIRREPGKKTKNLLVKKIAYVSD